MHDWGSCKNLLCIRADNMGDLIMSTPALRALKQTFECRITVLTSRAGRVITDYLHDVDDVIVSDLPWVQATGHASQDELLQLAGELHEKHFDGVIIFTVYSQTAMPAAMLAYLAGIPLRLAYARENPYALLTDWLPDEEPYTLIRHQVERDLALVRLIGATTDDDRLNVISSRDDWKNCLDKLSMHHLSGASPCVVLHAGVSEEKRKYPTDLWIALARQLALENVTTLVTGSQSEYAQAASIAGEVGPSCLNVAGLLTIGEFIALIDHVAAVVTVNTSTVHIAAALQTPSVVLYAQTNPQHTPWKSPHVVLPFSVPMHLRSRNVIIRHVNEMLYQNQIPYPEPRTIVTALHDIFGKNALSED